LEIGKRATFIWFVLVLITLLKSYFGNRKKWGLLQSHFTLIVFTEKVSVFLIEKKKEFKNTLWVLDEIFT